MAYKRISIKKSDKTNRLAAHDRIYDILNELLAGYIGVGKDTHEGATDTKFFIDEIADNFLRYDGLFQNVDIDISINSTTLEIELKISHDGNDFDPLSADSKCYKIKAAANRIQAEPQSITVGSEEKLKFKLKFNLKGKL